jgi:hypothetical protein
MNMHICRDQPEDPACAPRAPYEDADHYFYFSNVGLWLSDVDASCTAAEANKRFLGRSVWSRPVEGSEGGQ